MTTHSRTEEAGNTLVLKAGDRRSAASKRIGAIEKSIIADLNIERLTETLRVLCRRAAELTFMGEELSDRLVTGKAVSVELMGRNADRLQRTMKELREQAGPVRIREHNERVMRDLEDDDDDRVATAPGASRSRGGKIRSVIVDPKRKAS